MIISILICCFVVATYAQSPTVGPFQGRVTHYKHDSNRDVRELALYDDSTYYYQYWSETGEDCVDSGTYTLHDRQLILKSTLYFERHDSMNGYEICPHRDIALLVENNHLYSYKQDGGVEKSWSYTCVEQEKSSNSSDKASLSTDTTIRTP